MVRRTMANKSVPRLSTERFVTAWSFIVISGLGSATDGVTSM
jgi:hypothetical protein